MRGRRTALAVGVVLLLALGLRLWGIGFGLPRIAHDDEWQYVSLGASALENGSLRVRTSREAPYRNPTGFVAASALASVPVDAVQAGGLPGGAGTRDRYRANRAAYHLATRILSALMGVVAVLFTYRAARSVVGPRAALMGAALLAVSPLHVRDSHFATNDVALSALMIAALDMALRLRAKGPPSAGRLIGSGALLGAACAVKYSAGLLALPLLLIVAAEPRRPRPAPDAARALVLYGLGAALAFLVLFPPFVLEPFVVLESLRELAGYGKHPWPGQEPGAPWRLHLATLNLALGPLGFLASLLGMALLAKKRARILTYPLLHVVLFLPAPLVFARLNMPLLPFFCLGVAVAAKALGAGSGRRTAVALAAILLIQPAAVSLRIDRVFARPDTRAELDAWLSTQLAKSEGPLRLAVDGGAARFLPTAPNGDWNPRLRPRLLSPGHCPACKRELFVAARACLNATCPRRGKPADLFRDPESAVRSLRQDTEIFITTSFYFEGGPWHAALDAELAKQGERILTVSPGEAVPYTQEDRYGPLRHPWARERPGPEVRVYRVR